MTWHNLSENFTIAMNVVMMMKRRLRMGLATTFSIGMKAVVYLSFAVSNVVMALNLFNNSV